MSEDNNDEIELTSKSQLKREAHDMRDIGKKLISLTDRQLSEFDLPDRLKSAVLEMRRIKSFNAQKRHLSFVGKLVREVDVAPIQKILARMESMDATSTAQLHLLETWRERLIVEGKSALTVFLNEYHEIDVQQLRHLIKQAQGERERAKPPGAERALFRFLRESVLRQLNEHQA